jgi:hypothetical protein
MSKTVFICRDEYGNPIIDTISVTLVSNPGGVVYTSILSPVTGNNNGLRIFTDVTAGDYDLKYDGTIQQDLSPAYIPGPITATPDIDPGSIGATELANNAVTEDKIADDSISDGKLKSDSVTENKISNAAVTGNKIADGAILKVKLGNNVFSSRMTDLGNGFEVKVDDLTISYNASNELQIKPGSISTDKIADLGITSDKLVNNSVITNKINNYAVTSIKIGTSAIIAEKIANQAVTSEKIQDLSITADKMDPELVASLRLEVNRSPLNFAWVSPTFAETGDDPYFSDLQSAINYLQGSEYGGTGVIYLYPGTYLGPFTISGDISIIGFGRSKSILQLTPTTINKTLINMDESFNVNLSLQNLRVQVLSGFSAYATPISLIRKLGDLESTLSIDNCILSVTGYSGGSSGLHAYCLYAKDLNGEITNSRLFAQGGTGSSQGGNGINLYVSQQYQETILNLTNCDLQALKGSPNGKGYNYKKDNKEVKIYFNGCRLSSSDNNLESVQTEVTPNTSLINTIYSTGISSNIMNTYFHNSIKTNAAIED